MSGSGDTGRRGFKPYTIEDLVTIRDVLTLSKLHIRMNDKQLVSINKMCENIDHSVEDMRRTLESMK